MDRTIIALVSTTLLLAAATSLAAPRDAAPAPAPSDAGRTAIAAPATPGTTTLPERPDQPPLYGPIHARDPQVRAQIKRLYLAQTELLEQARIRVRELAHELREERDPDLGAALRREVAEVKRDAQRRHMEAGLEIARLNGDEPRVAEYEKALDQLLHPEKTRAAMTPRPARPARPERSGEVSER